jgi:hypothetical protein
MGCGLLTVWPGKLHSGRSPLLLLVALLQEVMFPSLHALLLNVHGHSVASLYGCTSPITSPPWLYRPNVGVQLKSRRPFEITYFLLHISSTRPRIKKTVEAKMPSPRPLCMDIFSSLVPEAVLEILGAGKKW